MLNPTIRKLPEDGDVNVVPSLVPDCDSVRSTLWGTKEPLATRLLTNRFVDKVTRLP
jgi:hypothetical protein